MSDDETLVKEIDELFNSRSVAVVGVPREMKAGRLLLLALIDQGFSGHIYPVNPKAEEIDGIKCYPSVSAIPEPVDLAIVLVPHVQSLAVIRECADKKVKGVVLFTAGYKETGTREGIALEEELLRVARSSAMRLIGPNAMGLYCPKTGLSVFPSLSKEEGPVSIISNSGSLTNIIGRIASQRGLRFSKVVSLGNESDLTCADFLTYFAEDPDTGVIGCYLEGVKKGQRFVDALKKASGKKPIVIWKVGLTPEGSRAAASHTGAMTGSREIWEGVVRQGGAIPVVGFEAWVDTLMGCSLLTSQLGDRMAIISGPGGLAVAAAEACGNVGLRLAELSHETRSGLRKIVPSSGTSLRNPIDVGLTPALMVGIFVETARIVAWDSGVDAIAVIGIGLTPKSNELYAKSMIKLSKEIPKPLIMIKIPGFASDLAQHILSAGVPFFHSAESAMFTYASIRRYQVWKEKRGH